MEHIIAIVVLVLLLITLGRLFWAFFTLVKMKSVGASHAEIMQFNFNEIKLAVKILAPILATLLIVNLFL